MQSTVIEELAAELDGKVKYLFLLSRWLRTNYLKV
jgi:hypothetical protein